MVLYSRAEASAGLSEAHLRGSDHWGEHGTCSQRLTVRLAQNDVAVGSSDADRHESLWALGDTHR
jgi:hypothetical protein